jgi:hypothetical protein
LQAERTNSLGTTGVDHWQGQDGDRRKSSGFEPTRLLGANFNTDTAGRQSN